MDINTMLNIASYDESPIASFFDSIPNTNPRYPKAKRLIEEAEHRIFLRSLAGISMTTTTPTPTPTNTSKTSGPIRPPKLKQRFGPFPHKFPGKCPLKDRERSRDSDSDVNTQHYLPSDYIHPLYPAIPPAQPAQPQLHVKKEEDQKKENFLNWAMLPSDSSYTYTHHPRPEAVVKKEEPTEPLLFAWTERSLIPKMTYPLKEEQPLPELYGNTRQIPARRHPKYARKKSIFSQAEI